MFVFSIQQWTIDECLEADGGEDYAYVEVYLFPINNTKYTMKLCFPGENYGRTQHTLDYDSEVDKVISKQTSSFNENETINKGSYNTLPFKTTQAAQMHHSESSSLELFSSGTQISARFRSSDGRFPSKGFRAKYKTGKLIFIGCFCII